MLQYAVRLVLGVTATLSLYAGYLYAPETLVVTELPRYALNQWVEQVRLGLLQLCFPEAAYALEQRESLAHELAQTREQLRQWQLLQPEATNQLKSSLHKRPYRLQRDALQQQMILPDTQAEISTGMLVLDEDVLLGRVTRADSSIAVVQLMTDYRSRLPVYIKHSEQSGVLVGRGHQPMSLAFVKTGAKIKEGDEVLFNKPEDKRMHGVRVGVVSRIDNTPLKGYLTIDVLPYFLLSFDKWYTLH